jgi:hypothetical protein
MVGSPSGQENQTNEVLKVELATPTIADLQSQGVAGVREKIVQF